VAGFNYGDFKKKELSSDEIKYQVEAYATTDPPGFLRELSGGTPLAPSAMAENAAGVAEASMRIYTAWFGPAPYGRIALTQQPQFSFGQSWPTLVYLPVSAFLDDTQRWMLMGRSAFRFAEFIQEVTPHEVAHQWWGHMVGWASYHDQWLSEGFSDFSAGLFLQYTEKKPDKYLRYLERARKAILEKNRYGRSANDAGPLWLGIRLDTFKNAGAYNRLVYPKGGFVLHMLRQLMWDPKTGDKTFIDMMHDFVQSNLHKAASTEDFAATVQKHFVPSMDLDGTGKIAWFFRQFVLGTEIPKYRLEYSLTAQKDGAWLLSGRLTQSEVADSFVMRVPLYLEFDGNVVRLGQVLMKGNTSFDKIRVKLPKKPKRVIVNYYEDVLASESVSKEVAGS
jgi:aminopeptidase N